MLLVNSLCFKTTRILLDTSASSSFISRKAVLQAKLPVYKVEPVKFKIANGGYMTVNEYVTFSINVSGIELGTSTFITDNSDSRLLPIGNNTLDQMLFWDQRLRNRPTQITMAKDDKNACKRRVIVFQDRAGTIPRMTSVGAEELKQWAADRNCTATEYRKRVANKNKKDRAEKARAKELAKLTANVRKMESATEKSKVALKAFAASEKCNA